MGQFEKAAEIGGVLPNSIVGECKQYTGRSEINGAVHSSPCELSRPLSFRALP